MKITSALFMSMLLWLPSGAVAKQGTASPIIGIWETEKKEEEKNVAHIKIEACKNDQSNLCGHIVWQDEPIDPETGKPKLDKLNPDESKRTKPIMGMQMMWHFKPANDDLTKYDNGEIYSAGSGKTYSGSMELKDDNTLELTGYVFVFWKTQTWKRVRGK